MFLIMLIMKIMFLGKSDEKAKLLQGKRDINKETARDDQVVAISKQECEGGEPIQSDKRYMQSSDTARAIFDKPRETCVQPVQFTTESARVTPNI